MSEAPSRSSAPRGRGSARGGRGGHSSRGGRGGPRSAKSDAAEKSSTPATYEDEGEIGQLKRKYASEIPTLKELFPDWTDDDLVFALEDSNGDLESAIEHITEGNVSQWGEVKKKSSDRSRSKAKEAAKTEPAAQETETTVRGGRARGGSEARGGRARGERGRSGQGRSRRSGGARTNGVRGDKSSSATESVQIPAATETATAEDAAPAKPAESGEQQTTNASQEAPKAAEPTKKGWASLFAKPTPPPPQKKPPPSTTQQQTTQPSSEPTTTESKPAPAVPAVPDVPDVSETKAPEPPAIPLTEPSTSTAATAPTESTERPKDDLTKSNLEQVPDVSAPPATGTAASTVASAQDPSSLPPVTPQTRSTTSGYASSSVKATAPASARSSTLQRRVLEQQEAVVMPANHAVDRAAVQFGSMGLNDADVSNIDEGREDAETRPQPPQHSPVAPRASLPPPAQTQPSSDAAPAARPAPGLPPVPQVSAADTPFNDFSRYAEGQKPYDPFTQQMSQPQTQVQEPFTSQAPNQAAATSASEYSPFYAGDQQRLPYNYYAGYPSQDNAAAQRAASGFGVSGTEGQPHAPTTQQPPGRYGHVEASSSGHNTPNPVVPAATTQQPSAQHIPGGQAGHGYSYGYPYYSNPHYASYMSQISQHQYGRNRPMYDDARRYDDHYMPHSNQYGYANQFVPYGKAGMYAQPFSYDHSSSPANAGGFNQGLPGRDSMYGRAGTTQPESQQPAAASSTGFGSGVPDVFGRSQSSGFGQNQPISQQQSVSSEETTKGFEASKAGGPSPSLAQANRPGSAANNVSGQPQSQSGLPPLQGQQGQQGTFGGYPHLNPQYGGGLGGLSGHQAGNQSHGSGYGNYGAGFGNYYGNTGRGGWGSNYGH